MKKLCLFILILFLTACSSTSDANTISRVAEDNDTIFNQAHELHYADLSLKFVIFEYTISNFDKLNCEIDIRLKDSQNITLLTKTMKLDNITNTLTEKNRISIGRNTTHISYKEDSNIFVGFASENEYEELYIDFAEAVPNFSFNDYSYISDSIDTNEISVNEPLIFQTYNLYQYNTDMSKASKLEYKIEFSILLSEANEL